MGDFVIRYGDIMIESANVETELKEVVKKVVEILKDKNFGIGITNDKKFVIIDKDSGKYMEIEDY